MSVPEQLNQAARCGDMDQIKEIIKNFKDTINHNDEVDAAHEAACHGHFDIVRFFIEHRGVDVNSISSKGSTFFHDLSAVQSSSALTFCRELVEERNINANVKDPQGKNPLHIACESGNQGLVEYLSNRYPGMVEEKDKSKSTQVCDDDQSHKENEDDLIREVENGNIAEVKRITKHLRKAGNQEAINKAAHLAAKHQHFKIFRYFIRRLSKPGVDFLSKDYDGSTYFHNLCCNTQEEAKDLFIELVEKWDIDVNVKDNLLRSPLHIACMYGNVGIVGYLSNKIPKMAQETDKCGIAPIFYALQHCKLDCFEILKDTLPSITLIAIMKNAEGKETQSIAQDESSESTEGKETQSIAQDESSESTEGKETQSTAQDESTERTEGKETQSIKLN